MKYSIDLDLQNQKKLFQYYAHVVNEGTFQKYRFYVLPKLPRRGKFRSRVIYLPVVKSYMSSFTKYAAYPSISSVPKSVRDDIDRQMQTIYARVRRRYEICIQDYEAVLPKFLNTLAEEVPEFSHLPVEIHPQLCGSIGRYCDDICTKIVVNPRYDISMNGFLRLIITCAVVIMRNSEKPRNSRITSPEVETEVAALISRPALQSFIHPANTGGTRDILTLRHAARYAKESDAYITSLGLEPKEHFITQSLTLELTPQEQTILSLLLKNRNCITPFEEIGMAVWGKDWPAHYSLYAISKSIQRIREKIKDCGIDPGLLHTERKIGYMLFD